MYTGSMTNKHFKGVNLTEFEPDKDEQAVIDNYVGGEPWVLVSISTDPDDGHIDLHVEGGGGMTAEKLVQTLATAALAVHQGYENAADLLDYSDDQ